MATWYTADLHFGHRNIISYCWRPWWTVEDMNWGLVTRFNSVVRPDDDVYILGDFSLSFPVMKAWALSLNGKLHLIAGNHDHCWDGRLKGRKSADAYLEAGFASVTTSGVVEGFKLGNAGPLVTLSHLPYQGDSQEGERFKEHRPEYRGLINVCGHVHDSWITSGHSINVGVDVRDWYPVSEEQLSEEVRVLLATPSVVGRACPEPGA